jgi:hypothetical protein
MLALGIAAVAAAGLGLGAAAALSQDETVPLTPVKQVRSIETAEPGAPLRIPLGRSSLSVPEGWIEGNGEPSLPGVLRVKGATLLSDSAIVTFARVASGGPSALPESVVAALPADARQPTVERVAGVEAYRWRSASGLAEAYAVLTSGGTIALMCEAIEPEGVGRDCTEAARSLDVTGENVLAAGPSGLFAQRALSSVERLNDALPAARRELRSTTTRADRSRTALRVASVVGDEARALQSVASTAEARRAASALRRFADLHRRLGDAAREPVQATYRRLAARLPKVERPLRSTLRRSISVALRESRG